MTKHRLIFMKKLIYNIKLLLLIYSGFFIVTLAWPSRDHPVQQIVHYCPWPSIIVHDGSWTIMDDHEMITLEFQEWKKPVYILNSLFVKMHLYVVKLGHLRKVVKICFAGNFQNQNIVKNFNNCSHYFVYGALAQSLGSSLTILAILFHWIVIFLKFFLIIFIHSNKSVN